jgi:prepilin-type processing-associated H-X9-DG protein
MITMAFWWPIAIKPHQREAPTRINGVYGVMSYNANDTDSTNETFLVNSLLAPYSYRSKGIYKCCADRSYVVLGKTRIPRVRTMAMNFQLGSGDKNKFKKMNEIVNPSPVMTFVFIDEHEDSINDGYFKTDGKTGVSAEWKDLPGSSHGNACGLSFADGHAEIHKWIQSDTCKRVERVDFGGMTAPNSRDIQWLQTRVFPQ